MTNELPEVGSRWTIDGAEFTVAAVRKKGRGYYVERDITGLTAKEGVVFIHRARLQDFRKKAKPVE